MILLLFKCLNILPGKGVDPASALTSMCFRVEPRPGTAIANVFIRLQSSVSSLGVRPMPPLCWCSVACLLLEATVASFLGVLVAPIPFQGKTRSLSPEDPLEDVGAVCCMAEVVDTNGAAPTLNTVAIGPCWRLIKHFHQITSIAVV